MKDSANQITREELFDAVWTKPIKSLAAEWNTTYARIIEACQKLGVPRPGQGHWQLVARGQILERDALPTPAEDTPREIELLPPGRRPKKALHQPTNSRSETPERDKAPGTLAPNPEVESRGSPSVNEEPRTKIDIFVERALLDMLRQATKIDFWNPVISVCHRTWSLAGWLKLDLGNNAPESQQLNAVKRARKDYHSFQVRIEEIRDRYNQDDFQLSVSICLRDGFEWKDAWEEAWSLAEKPNPHSLSDNALRLYQWAKGPKNTGRMMEMRKIGAQAGLRHTYDHIEEHLREIQLKVDPDIKWARGEIGWRAPFRIWFETTKTVRYVFGPLNPLLGLNLASVEHAELERFKHWLHAEVLKPGFPDEAEVVGILDLRDRKTVTKVFSRLPADCGRYGRFGEFFDVVRLVDGIRMHRDFADGGGPWILTCQPNPGHTWRDIKSRLTAKAAEIPLEQKYSLSADSLALLRWIQDLRGDECLQGMTPPVEEHLIRDVGIKVEWGEENVRAYLEVLAEEINEKTEFNLRTVPWRHRGRVFTRILVKMKRTEFDELVRAIQIFGLGQNQLLDCEAVRIAIRGLLLLGGRPQN